MRSFVITLLALTTLYLVSSCDRYLAQPEPSGEPAEGPTILNVRAVVDDTRLSLSWQSTDTNWADHYRVYLSESPDGSFVLIDSSTDFSHTLDNLLLDRRYYARIAPVNASGLEGLPSATVSAHISHLSFTIDQRRPATNSREVVVSFNVPDGAGAYQLDEDALSPSTPWLAFSPSVTFQLSSGDGIKTLVARVQFEDGAVTGDLLSGHIVLDTRAQISGVGFSPQNSTFAPGDVITFTLAAGELGGEAAVSFGDGQTVALRDDGLYADQGVDDGVYSGTFLVPPSYRLVQGKVTGRFTDAVGNRSDDVAAADLLDISSPPAVPSLAAVGLSTHQIQLSWDRSDATDFSSYLLYRAIGPDVSDASTLAAVYASDSVTYHVDTALSDNTVFYYRLYVQNTLGQRSESDVTSAATFVNTAPQAVALAGGLEGENTARLTWSISEEEDFATYELFWSTSAGVDTFDNRLAIVSDRSELSNVQFVPSNTTRHYRIYVRDRHGLLSPGSNEVSVTSP
ncbi:MAG: fibronectin type III domain-containing protein [bacterium]